MYKKFLDSMVGVFNRQRFRNLLVSRCIVIHLLGSDAACEDPFVAALVAQDSDSKVDITTLDSWWHVTHYAGSPKDCTFRRMFVDSRVEEKFADNEIKLKVLLVDILSFCLI